MIDPNDDLLGGPKKVKPWKPPKGLRRMKLAEQQAAKAKIDAALRSCHGNVPMTARALRMSLSRLDDFMRTIRELPKVFDELKSLPAAAPEYTGLSLEQIEQDILRRATLYRSEALDALYDLAMMPLSLESAPQNQVKLQAAAKLYNVTGDEKVGNEIEVTLRSLNEQYHAAAPRIQSIRERTITFGEEEQKVIEHEP